MKLLVEEGVDRQIVDRLRKDGHNVLYVAEMEPGIADDEVLDLANREGRLLLTADNDFGEIIFRQRRAALGVVLIRLVGLSQERKGEIVALAIQDHTHEIEQTFTVVMPGMVRIRRRFS